jgi:SagB-type dehydrogenase family enzyme
VEGVPAGIYRYLTSTHELALVREGDLCHDLERAALGQRMVVEANVVVALTAVFERTERRYGGRAQRYIAMEAGHIAQNLCLIATALGLGTCVIGAFRDDAVNRVLGLDGHRESILYLVTIGTIERSNV